MPAEPERSTQQTFEEVFKYDLGKHRVKDTEGGDAGGILRQSKNFPYVSFVRS